MGDCLFSDLLKSGTLPFYVKKAVIFFLHMMILQAGKQVDSLCEAPDHLLLSQKWVRCVIM